MAAVHLPLSAGWETPTFGPSRLGTPMFGHSYMGTASAGVIHSGTPTFGTAYAVTPTMGTSHVVTPNLGQSHLGASPGGAGSPNVCPPSSGTSSHGHSSIQHVVQPVICSHPSYRGPVLQNILAHKPRSPPDSMGSGPLPDSPEEPEKCSTPYRLPRISPRGTPCTEDGLMPLDPADDKVWGRFGYEDNVRMPELGPSIHKALMMTDSTSLTHPHPSGPGALGGNPTTPGVGSRAVVAAQRCRQTAMIVPKFRNAAIIPSVTPSSVIPSVPPNIIKDVPDSDVRVYKSLLEKVGGANQYQNKGGGDLTPIPDSVCLSPGKSIHWALGSHKHPLFDYKGRSRKQGPYSREFTVHCMPPATWMRMKWGRQRATAH